MDSEEAAYASAKEKHNKYMVLPGKNQKVRYIEVFQVSSGHLVSYLFVCWLAFNAHINTLHTFAMQHTKIYCVYYTNVFYINNSSIKKRKKIPMKHTAHT